MAEEKKKKNKKTDIMIDSGKTANDVVSEDGSMKKKKKKNRETKDGSTGEDGDMIVREKEKLGKKKSKKQRIDSEADDGVKKSKKKKNKETMVDSEVDDTVKEKSKNKEINIDSEAEDGAKEKSKKKKNKETMVDSEVDDAVKEKSKNKEINVDSEAEDGVKEKSKKKKKKKESEVDVIVNSERSKVCEKPLLSTDDANKKKAKRKRDESDLGAEENTEDKEMMMKKNKKKKLSVDSEAEENNNDSVKDAKPSVDSEVEDIKLKSTENVKKKSKEKKPNAEENDLNTRKDSKKKRKQSKVSEVEKNNKDSKKDAKKKSKEKKRNEDSMADENNNDSTKDAKKKRKKKQECDKSDKDMATPSSKSTKKVKFAEQLENFAAEDDEEEEVKLVRGKRYSKEEDELVKGSVLEYIDNHALGDEGIKMVMECKSHPQVKGCWKEIASAIPWRTLDSVYNRAHTLFEEGSRGVWTKEDLALVVEFQKKHGNDWRTLADAMGKHRKHVKDAWRRIRLTSRNKGHWMREEYQALFDLVNKDLRMKAFQEKHSKHGMLRDNIPWMAISDKLESRDHVTCCGKWYDQLQSPMVAKGIWANVDDYRLLEELLKLDAPCIDDVDWDNLLENRDGEACRKRWNQMVLHIGSPRSKTFAEQVEILSERYRPELAEDREDFDNRPYDPED